MKVERVNIGLSIEQRLNELGMSKSEFGRKIGIPQQNVNRILEKASIDTDKLTSISEALNFNFLTASILLTKAAQLWLTMVVLQLQEMARLIIHNKCFMRGCCITRAHKVFGGSAGREGETDKGFDE